MRWIAAVLFCVLATSPSTSSARCAMAVGERLHLVLPSGHVAPGGVLLFAREPVMHEREVMRFPITQLTLRSARCAAHCTHHAPLRSIAINLFALDVPVAMQIGDATVVETRSTLAISAGPTPTTPSSAPVLSATPMGTVRAGTASLQASLDVATPAPTGAVGILMHWRSTTWFTAITPNGSGSAPIGPRRCTPQIPGREPMAIGNRLDVSYIGEGGGVSPTTSITSTLDVEGAPVTH